MSKYTTEVRFICEKAAGFNENQDYDRFDNIIAKSREKIFDFTYPIFDESYRSVIETKILKHYYTREIGLETVGLWKHFLGMRMNEIMPYYNKLYNSELIEFNPMYNVKYDTTHNGSASGNTTDKATGSMSEDIEDNRKVDRDINVDNMQTYADGSMDKFSDTPQGSVQNLRNETYLTNAREISATGNATGNTKTADNTDEDYTRDRSVNTRDNKEGTFSNTDQYLRHVEGNNGSRTFSELLKQYRETFINIDMMVINELNDLFMGVW